MSSLSNLIKGHLNCERTWGLHHCLHVLLLQLLDAFCFGLTILLKAADLVYILII